MDIRSRERGPRDVAMLASQITDLARSWVHRVARRLLTTDVRVLVGLCASAVAVGRDGLVVDMVHL